MKKPTTPKPKQAKPSSTNMRLDALTEEISRINALNDELDVAHNRIVLLDDDVFSLKKSRNSAMRDIEALEHDNNKTRSIALAAFLAALLAIILQLAF